MEDNQQHDTSGDVENTDNETVELTKGQESLTEEKRPPGFENMPTGLPPIDIHELAKVLRDPNMPSQKIMNEVADHIIKKASQKDNSSTVGDGASEGMKSVVDCIIEVCLKQDDSDDSDEDDDYYEDEKILREIPCKFCNKIFNSSMTCKTHVLVAHPQLDPSVLNIKYLSEKDVNKKNSSRRRSSRCSSKTEGDVKQPNLVEALAQNESTQLSVTSPETPLPCLSESVQGAAESTVSGQQTGLGSEPVADLNVPDTIDTCDTTISGSLTESGVRLETTHGSPSHSVTMDCEQGDSQFQSNSPPKHKMLESENYAETASKKSRVESNLDAPPS
ncbi:uncharacterized protein LOC106058267 [Biomphalaria glabrata]|uniref:Uncharacterized protein LOC106058267 n=1 Tax=Biomphalaria glabrata TaxID=6526 RepID=A0A9U8E377_BIOGL|nr:uncharacterized protein LOC106058267 [Biomphalaria glabrata]XP_055878825.1 uncharacterized protein LOC106058267 [Biomphalaria glabrata]